VSGITQDVDTKGKKSNKANEDLALKCFSRARSALKTHTQEFPDFLSQTWGNIHNQWLDKIHPRGPEELFLGPEGTPAFPLLAFVAESVLPQPASEPLWLASEAMVHAYFGFRCQDDIVDEEAPRERIYLGQHLVERSLRLMVEAAGDGTTMLREWECISRDFAASALADARLRTHHRGAWPEVAVTYQRHKFLPMLGPLVALLIRANRRELIPQLRRGSEQLSLALQLANDWASARRDLETEQDSPYLRALGLRPGLHRQADLLPAVRRAIRLGAYQRYGREVDRAFDQVTALLPAFSSPRLARHLAERREAFNKRRETEMMRALATAHPLMVDIELTRRCNLTCPTCFVRTADRTERAERELELPWTVVNELLEEAAGYATELHLTGGEPFLYGHLWELFTECERLGLDRVVINTNGTLLDEERLDRLAAIPLEIELLVSIDGPPSLFEAGRGREATGQAITALAGSLQRGLPAQAATMLTEELVEYGLPRWCQFLRRHVGDEVAVVLWPLFAHREVPGLHVLSRQSLWEAAQQVVALTQKGQKIAVAEYPQVNVLLKAAGLPNERLWQCRAGSSRLCVQADGTVTPCHPNRLVLDQVTAGQTGGCVARALSHPWAQRLARRDHEGCVQCADRHFCGSCQAAVTAQGRPLFSSHQDCFELRQTAISPDTNARHAPIGARSL
jgi:radical SAM protein with 4Fe4S-binding SPASM domain